MSEILAVQAGEATAAGTSRASDGPSARHRSEQAGSTEFASTLSQAGKSRYTATDGGESANPYKDFETMVVSQLVSTMLSTGASTMFGEEGGMQAFSSIFAGAIGEEVVDHGGIGLAEAIARNKPA